MNLLSPVVNDVIVGVGRNQTAPWFGWGATSATSTTYNCNLQTPVLF